MLKYLAPLLIVASPALTEGRNDPLLACQFGTDISIQIAENGDKFTWDEGNGLQVATVSAPTSPESFGMITTITDKGVAVIFVKNETTPKMAILSWPAVRLRGGVEIPDVTTITGQCEDVK